MLLVAVTAIISTGRESRLSARAADWPRNDARWTIDLFKAAGHEPTDLHWLHLMHPGETVTIGVRVTERDSTLVPLAAVGVQVRYTVHGVPVSDWLSTPFTYTLSIDNPALNSLDDGVHDVSVEVQGADRMMYKPRRVYLHLARGRTVSPLVPIISRDVQYGDYGFDWGPGVVYVNYADRRAQSFPVNPSVTPWHGAPFAEDLYQEEMAPHTDLFMGVQMWWEQAGAPHLGAKFTRALVPKWDEDHRGLRVVWSQERFPFIDGPRGVAWTSAYITGQVDSTGGLVFTEAGGPLRYMAPDGTVTTIVGWRVRPDRDPIWVGKPVNVVRNNMEFRGTFADGRYSNGDGFRTPLDVAIDPLNSRIYYVVGYEDHCIWKVDATAGFENAQVSVFAGDPGHAAGFGDGVGAGARFNGPASIVFDPVSNAMYVADQDNDAIRKITRDRVVTTLFGSPGMGTRLASRTSNIYNQQAARDASVYTVSAAQAAGGTRPEIYVPQAVRVDSHGNLILLELGYGGIRRINPHTGETVHLGNVWQRFESSSRGWAWIDVDRWGNSGPLDSIYWVGFQLSHADGEAQNHPNEAYGWLPASGGASRWVFQGDWDPYPDGWGPVSATDPPHYGWLVAVDPRGAVYLAGGGEHGITRLRKRRVTDTVPPDYIDYLRGKDLWRSGGMDVGNSFALKFGWEAHNYLGYSDAWAAAGGSDADLIAAFEIPAAVQADGPKLRTLLNFIRLNGGVQVGSAGGWTPPPAPPSSGGGGGGGATTAPETGLRTLTVIRAEGGMIYGAGLACGSLGTSCSVQFPSGTFLALDAVPDAGNSFGGWSATCPAGRITLTSDVTCIGAFNASASQPAPSSLGLLTISRPTGGTIYGPGIVCGTLGSACSVEFPNGATIGLDAVPDPGQAFLGWPSACAGGSVTLAGAASCAPGFGASSTPPPSSGPSTPPPSVPGLARLTITPPANGTVAGPGIFCGALGASCTMDFPVGITLGLEAIPSPGATLTAWSAGCGGGLVVLSGNQTCSPTFAAGSSGSSGSAGGGSSSSTGGGGGGGATPPAPAAPGLRRLTIVKPTGGTILGAGIVCGTLGDLCFADYPGSITIGLDAVPDAGHALSGWSTNCAGGVVSLAASVTCNPAFSGSGGVLPPAPSPTPGPPSVGLVRLSIITSSGGQVFGAGIRCGGGETTCAVDMPAGARIGLDPVPLPGFDFGGWSGTGCGPLVSLTAPRTCTAVFTARD